MPTYTGTAGADTITGSATADIIDGLAGTDILHGDGGDDVIDGGDDNDTLYGDDGNDTLNGGAGNDYLDGGVGADAMAGGAFADTYVVDNVFDTVVELAGGGTDTVLSSVNYALAANVERLTLTGGAISGTGNALVNILTGNASDNYLFGDNSTDTLYGMGGNDTLYGGSDGSVDVLDGGTGDDIMYGGAGDDFYYVDSLNDAAVENAGEGTGDTIRAWIDWTLSATGNIENIQQQGSGNLNATGTAGGNFLIGNSGDNQLSGLGGTDTIHGNGGNDRITGGTGNDLLYGEAGYDTFVILDESANRPTLEADIVHDLDIAGGDRIDFSGIDADTGVGGDQAFTFVSSFTGTAGEARILYDGVTYTNVDLDVDGDGATDYQLKIAGDVTGTQTDILTGAEPISDGGWLL